MSIKIWSLIIVSVKAPSTSIYRAKQSSVFKRMPCLPGSWHMVECGIFVITGQFCAGWCYYYFTSSRSQNRIMTCYEWPRNRAYFNMLTAGANDPAVIRFAPAVITFCFRDIKNVIRYFACHGSKMNNM